MHITDKCYEIEHQKMPNTVTANKNKTAQWTLVVTKKVYLLWYHKLQRWKL